MKMIKRGCKKLGEEMQYHLARTRRKDRNTTKIFCVGRNKTGTTSLAAFFKANGYKVGSQEKAELFMEDWIRRDFDRLIEFCKTAEVFQDIPFSLPDTYQALDKAYPGSKFILTIRSSAEEWFHSRVTHHIKRIAGTGNPPTEEDLRQYKYRNKRKGWILFMQKAVYGYPAVPLYDPDAYMAHYQNHNRRIMEYFDTRPFDLLVVNLAEEKAFEKICDFVGLDPLTVAPIPHENRSDEM